MVLQALEFSDCMLDSPHFRERLTLHERELDNTSKAIKKLTQEGKELISAAKALSRAQKTFASTLHDFKFETIGNQQTDAEMVIAQSFKTFADIISEVESARDKMLEKVNDTFIGKMETFRKEQIGAAKEGHKKFEKMTKQYCQSLEKHLSLKVAKSDSSQLSEADASLETEKKNFQREAMNYVMLLQEVQEKKKYEFVEVVHVFMQGWLTFYHEGHELASDRKPYMQELQEKIQLTRDNFAQTREEVRNLMNKVLEDSEENVPKQKMFTIQGYLYLMEKKPLIGQITWSKYFCSYQKETKIFSMIPYNQSAGNAAKLDLTPETLVLESCVRRMSDSVDRRFCFDITLVGKPAPYTLQAPSEEERRSWMDAMEGTEPLYAKPQVPAAASALDGGGGGGVPDCHLDVAGADFVAACVQAIEERGLTDQGLYRVVGVSSKVNKLLQAGLDPKRSEQLCLLGDDSEWEVKTMTSALKHYFRKLPEPIMTFRMHQKFIQAAKLEKQDRVTEVESLMKKLPLPNCVLLKRLIGHLNNVAENSNQNLMTVSNLGVCFGPTLLRPEEETVAAIMDIKFCNVVVEILIENFSRIFDSVPDDICAALDPSNSIGTPKASEQKPAISQRPVIGGGVIGGGVLASGAGGPLPFDTYGKTRRANRPVSVFPLAHGGAAVTKSALSDSSPNVAADVAGNGGVVDSQGHLTLAIAESLPALAATAGLSMGSRNATSVSPKPALAAAGRDPSLTQPAGSACLKNDADRKPSLAGVSSMSRSFSGGSTVPADSRLRHDAARVPVKRNRLAPTATAALLAAKGPAAVATTAAAPHGRSARVRTLFACEADNDSELSFEPNQIIYNVRESREPGWLEGTLNGKTGLMPANYVQYID